MVMGAKILNVRYHDFQQVRIQNNIVLAKCNCCNSARYAVFAVNGNDRIFYYHGYDGEYAKKLFSSLASRFQSE